MPDSPITQVIRLILGLLLLIWILVLAESASSEEFAVPHGGSPYVDLDRLNVGEIVHLPTGIRVSLDQMIDTLSGARVIYFGETHDNLEAHRAQAELIRGLDGRFPGRIAVGMEMFRRPAQPGLDRWARNEMDAKEFRRLFQSNWGSGFKMYEPIFDYLHQHSIPLLGLKSGRELENRFRNEGPGQVDFPEIDTEDPYHRPYAMSTFGGHTSPLLEKPYLMLLLWEETMAETVAAFLRDPLNRDKKLVVLAGGFHVQYGFGIPRRAFRRVPHAYSIVLPVTTELPEELKDREMKVEHVSIPLYAADFAWKMDYKVFPAPKVKLGVRLEEESGGLKVTAVSPGSNADRAEVRKGDLIVSLDGNPIAEVELLVDQLRGKSFGDVARLSVRREENEMELPVILNESPSPKP